MQRDATVPHAATQDAAAAALPVWDLNDLYPGPDSAELKRLKRENAELKRANAILKAASAFFAAELDRPLH